jgi:hypothetical protein
MNDEGYGMKPFKVLVFALVVFFQASSVWAAATLVGVVKENQAEARSGMWMWALWEPTTR